MSAYRNKSQSWQAGWPDQPPSYPAGDGYRPRYQRRKRHRGLKALIVIVVVLAAAFVGADQFARGYAQKMIAQKVQSSSHLASAPSVSIKGWPFLTQVAARNIGQIDLSERNVRESTLDITSINATALGVHIDSAYTGATIATINGTALITFSSLVSATGAKGVTLSDDPSGGPNTAKISVGQLHGVASVTQSGPASISVKAQSLNGIPLAMLGSLGDYTINVPHLPMGMSVTGLSVTPQGIAIKVTAHNTTLSGGGSSLGG